MRNGLNAAALSRELGVTQAAIWYRLNKGQSVDHIRQALTDPTRKAKPSGRPPQPKGANGLFADYKPAVLTKQPVVNIDTDPAPVYSGKSVGLGRQANGSITKAVRDETGKIVNTTGNGLGDFATPADAEAERLIYGTTASQRADAELRHTLAKAEKEELLVAQRKGELVEISAVLSFEANNIAQAQDILLRIPTELRDQLAAETDPVRVGELLDREIRRALAKLKRFGQPTSTEADAQMA